jgi:hypothetical protein
VPPPADGGLLGWQERLDALPFGLGQAGHRHADERHGREGCGTRHGRVRLDAPSDMAALGHRLVRPPEARPAQQEGLCACIRTAGEQEPAHLGYGDRDQIRPPFCVALLWRSCACTRTTVR